MASLKALIPENFASQLAIEANRKALVLGDVVNNSYQGVISGNGDTVIIPVIPQIAVKSHTRNATVTYDQLDATTIKLLIDQEKEIAYAIDRVDTAQVAINLVAALMNRAGYEFANASDAYIAGLGTQATTQGAAYSLGTAGSPLTVTAAASTGGNTSAYEVIGRLAKGLDNLNVPQDGRFLVIPPWFHMKCVMAGLFTLQTTDQNALLNGRVGRVMGFDVRMSTNLTNYNTTASHIIAGDRNAIAFASQVLEINMIDKMETKIGSGVQGIYVYGAKVIQPDNIALAIASEGTA